MANAIYSIAVILLSLALLIAGTSLLGTLLAIRMTLEGFPHGAIGPILAFHSLGFVLGTLYLQRMIRRVGHIRSFAALAAVACVTALLHPLWVNGFAWAGLRVLTGFCAAGLMMVMESWINDRTSNALRGTVMAVYMATNYLAQGGGQFTLGLGKPDSTGLFMAAAILIALSLVPLALTRAKAPVLERGERMGLKRLFRVAPVGIVGALLAGTAMSGFMAMLPVYAQETGLRIDQISVLMGVAVLFGMVMQYPVGFLSDRYDRRAIVVMLALLALLICLILILYAGPSFTPLFIFSGLFVGVAGSLYPLCVAITNDYLHSHQMVSASASLLLIFGIGTIIGPVGSSLAMTGWGPQGLFLFAAGAVALLATFGLVRHLTARRFPVAEQAEYVMYASGSTPVIFEIDPRNLDYRPAVVTPARERRSGDRRASGAGGRRRGDAADFNE